MKPVRINLVKQKKVWSKISLGLAAVLTAVTCAVTLVNTYDYFENTKVIRIYEKRVKELNSRTERKRREVSKKRQDSKEADQFKKDVAYFSSITEKSLFPLTDLLTRIEKVRPQKVDIDSLLFSDNLHALVIRGSSGQVSAITRFITELGKSGYFDIQLSKEEIMGNKSVEFELTARWTGGKNG